MSTPTLQPPRTPATREQLEFALSFFADEHEKLWALAAALLRQVEPVDPDNPGNDVDMTAWRLAQVLVQRLGGTEFMGNTRGLLLGGG